MFKENVKYEFKDIESIRGFLTINYGNKDFLEPILNNSPFYIEIDQDRDFIVLNNNLERLSYEGEEIYLNQEEFEYFKEAEEKPALKSDILSKPLSLAEFNKIEKAVRAFCVSINPTKDFTQIDNYVDIIKASLEARG